MASIRILCIDDHAIVREGIIHLISREPDIMVVGSAATGEAGLALFRSCRPDVTLMDLRLGTMSGIQVIRAIRSEDASARVVVLTMYQGDEDIRRALEAGAAAYVHKDTVAEQIVRVIRDVHAGVNPGPIGVASQSVEEWAENAPLTPREIEVIGLIAEGMRNKEIAVCLGIAEETVHVHVKNIFQKLKVNDRTAAMNVALRRGIIHVP